LNLLKDIGKINPMKREESIKAGIFIVVTVTLLALVIFVMGSDKQIFSSQEEYLTTFSDIKGLAEGAPVRLAGITVGRVSDISFSDNRLDTMVHVKFLVNKKYLGRIFHDSIVSIETQGLLGDRFLSIIPGKEKKLAPAGSTLNSSEPADIAEVLNKAALVVDNTVEISNNFNDFVKDLNKDTLGEFTRAAKSIANLTQEVEKGEGLFHKLLYSKKDGEDIAQGISQTSKGVGEIISEIKSGSGVLNNLIYGENGPQIIQSLVTAGDSVAKLAVSFNEIAGEIKTGHGLANQMIYGDPEHRLDDVIAKLNQTADNLKKASEAVAQGSGTLGSLIIDSRLYDNLVEVTEGAKRSFLLRQAIRNSLNK
jgi:phospholipid/cholesterol/gamma-HCH transport system substrate-binding protein